MAPVRALAVCGWYKICTWVSSDTSSNSRIALVCFSSPSVTSQAALEGINKVRNMCLTN